MGQVTVYSNSRTTMYVCVQVTHGAVDSGVKHNIPTTYPNHCDLGSGLLQECDHI